MPKRVILLPVFIFLITAAAHSQSFNRTDIPTGSAPQQVAVADFNRDGKPDIVVANGGSVSILLGNGDGTFRAPITTTVNAFPRALAVGDLNGDGIPDVVINDYVNGGLYIFLGKGDGTFEAPTFTSVGGNGIAIGDFNGDGKADIAVTNSDNNVRICLGNGDGTFSAPSIVSAGAAAQPIVIIARDLNNDGKLDLVTVNMFSDNISVLIGNGDGSFRAAVNYAVEAASVPQALAVGDVNGDGVPDIIVGETSLFKVAVLLGNGDGTLTNHGYFSLPRYIHDVAIGDVNGDGRADLVAATNYGTTNTSFATVLLGDGSGTFGAAQDWAVDAGSTSVAVTDFNHDGMLDIVTADSASTGVTVLLNTLPINKGTFTIVHSFTSTTGASSGTLTEVIPGIFFGQEPGGVFHQTSGSIFAVTGAGGFKQVHPFNVNIEGRFPNGYLLGGHTGLLYGVTSNTGFGSGTLFSADLRGSASALFSFPAGSRTPYPVVEAADGSLYGVVAGSPSFFYRATLSGAAAILHTFNSLTEGTPVGPVNQGSDGSFYGLSILNNAFNQSVAYKVSNTGVFSLLHTFTDRTQIVANSLAVADNGNFYGSTQNAGPECRGTIFELTQGGTLTTLITTTGTSAVCSPTTLVEASDGKLYGVDTMGGFGHGRIFRLTLSGTLSTVHDFAVDGSEGIYGQTISKLLIEPFGPALVQGSDGKLYGISGSGGPGGVTAGGTIYSLDLGLPKPLPRIRYFSPASGKVGSGVLIVGANLLGLSQVKFNGVSATQFASRGSNYAVAVVPSGATSGPITITTPNGGVISKASFTVQ
jgi:hypothetical protein